MVLSSGPVLVLGLGNRLASDDGVGPLAIDRLSACNKGRTDAVFLDGGTLGLSLLPRIESAAGLIAVDAAALGMPAGTVQVFEGEAMDRFAGARKASAHEVALSDLLGAAVLSGALPQRRALVTMEPQTTALGMPPSQAVSAALPRLCEEIQRLLQRWSQ